MIFSTGSQPGAGLETVCSDAVVGSGVLVVNSGVVIVGFGVVAGSAVVGSEVLSVFGGPGQGHHKPTVSSANPRARACRQHISAAGACAEPARSPRGADHLPSARSAT